MNNDKLIDLLKHVLAKTLKRHSNLCYGVIDKSDGVEAHLHQLSTIEWDDVVDIQQPGSPADDASLSASIGRGHEYMFPDQTNRPPWRIIVLPYDSELDGGDRRVDLLFFCHHAITDGTGASAFQKTFAEYLQESITKRSETLDWPYRVPENIPSPVFVQDTFPLDTLEPVKPTPSSDKPSFTHWTASPPFMASIELYRSYATTLSIPYANVTTILAHCRLRSITFTGFLHALIIAYLTKAVPDAKSFKGSTPISLRRFTKIPNTEIANHVSAIDTDWLPEYISSFRACSEGSEDEERVILAISKQFQDEVKEELLAAATTGGSSLSFAAGVKDFDALCHEGMKATKRGKTYEISNVGLVSLTTEGEEGSKSYLERLVFSQCGSVTGSAIGCSVVSVKQGPLSICLHWQEGAVDADLMFGMNEYLKRRLLAVK